MHHEKANTMRSGGGTATANSTDLSDRLAELPSAEPSDEVDALAKARKHMRKKTGRTWNNSSP